MNEKIDFEGMTVTVFRGDDGHLVIDIATQGLAPRDTFGSDKLPRVRVWMNEALLHDETGDCLSLDSRF